MAERHCAAGSRVYNILKDSYVWRDDVINSWKAEGKTCIWVWGDDVPEELILAAGMMPVRLIGEYREQPNADKYLELSFGALWRGHFEKIVNGSCADSIEYLVMSNSSDIIQKLYYYLLQLKRIEPERRLPTMHYIDYSLMVKDFSAQERNLRETREFIEVLEHWSGKSVSHDDICDAINLCNSHREALRRISLLRRQNRITGSEALNIIAGSFFVERAEAVRLLNELLNDAVNWPVVDAVKAVYTGSLQETDEVYQLMEECGINIIADDKLIGDRYSDCDVDINMEPTVSLSRRYHLRFPSSERGFVAERARCIPELVENSGAEALIVFMNHNDESYIWDFPKQKIRLDELGIQTLFIEKQFYPLREKELLAEKLKKFADDVAGGRKHG